MRRVNEHDSSISNQIKSLLWKSPKNGIDFASLRLLADSVCKSLLVRNAISQKEYDIEGSRITCL
jgi:hypothetical protein